MKSEARAGLLLAAAPGTVAYGYDARGRRIGETQPNANLASCP